MVAFITGQGWGKPSGDGRGHRPNLPGGVRENLKPKGGGAWPPHWQRFNDPGLPPPLAPVGQTPSENRLGVRGVPPPPLPAVAGVDRSAVAGRMDHPSSSCAAGSEILGWNG